MLENIYDVCNAVKYWEICAILSRQYFLDFTIFHYVSHVSQYCTLYCTAVTAARPPGRVTSLQMRHRDRQADSFNFQLELTAPSPTESELSVIGP